MSVLSKIFNKNKKDENSKQLTLHEKWELDAKAYDNPNYKVKTGEIQCYKCVNRIKVNNLKCSNYENIPKEILLDQKKCEDCIEIKEDSNSINEEIKKTEETFNIKLSKDYIEFMKSNNGYTGLINGEYFDIWKIEDIISRNSDYQVQEFFPNLIYFGANGGDQALAFDKSNNMCIVNIPFIGTEKDKTIVANTFRDFIKDISIE